MKEYARKIFKVLFIFTFISLVGILNFNKVNATNVATIEDGKIMFSVEAYRGSTESWRYKTVGFTLTTEPVPNGDPNLVPHTEIMYLEEVNQTYIGSGKVIVDFEISAETVIYAIEEAGLPMPEDGEKVYLHAAFQLIPPNETEPTGTIYTTLGGISTAQPWSEETLEALPNYYNIEVYYDAPPPATVTVKHVEYETGDVLLEEAFQVNQGEQYTISTKPSGYFPNNLIAYPKDEQLMKEMSIPPEDIEYTLVYREALPDPSGVKEYSEGTSPSVSGDVCWKLMEDGTVVAENNLYKSGTHFATKDELASIQSKSNVTNDSSATFVAEEVKNTDIYYTYRYEYTNHYYEAYIPVESNGEYVFEWKSVSKTPSWEYSEVYESEIRLNASHNYGETFEIPPEENTLNLLIGQSQTIGEDVNNYYETFYIGEIDTVELETQTCIPLVESISYKNDYGETVGFDDNNAYFLPVDIDENLQEEYENNTAFSEWGKYAIPIELVASFAENEVIIEINTTEDFYLSEKTGVLISVEKGTSFEQVQEEYETYFSEIGGTYDENDIFELKEDKYYIPISANSELLPETMYTNYYALSSMGISNVSIIFGQNFSFEKYLVGSVYDGVYANEEPAPIVDVAYTNEVELSNEQVEGIVKQTENRSNKVHGFKNADALLIHELLAEEGLN